MKKLMIAAAVAMMAVASQAAATSWSTGRAYWSGVGSELSAAKTDGTNNARLGAESTAYLFAGLTQKQFEAFTSAADIWDAFDATTMTLKVKDASGQEVIKNKTESGTFNSGKVNFAYAPEIGDGQYDYAVVIVTHTTDNVVDAYSANAVAPGGTAMDVVGADKVALNWGLKAAGDATVWQSVSDVPEPTSGLLLLLGVAGLALRRRRA